MENDSMNIEQQVITLIRQLMQETGNSFVQRTMSLATSLETLGIDSLGKAELLVRIEKHFNVQLEDTVLVTAESIGDVVKAIVKGNLPNTGAVISSFKPNSINKYIEWNNATTLIEVLLIYAKQAPDQAHVYFQNEKGSEVVLTYGKLLEQSLKVTAGLKKLDLQEGDTVAIMQPTSLNFFYAFFGVLLCGGIPVPIYPPSRPHQIEEYIQHEAKILNNANIQVLITFQEAKILSNVIQDLIPSMKTIVTVDALLKNEESPLAYAAEKNTPALIQYTSGSTSAPKGVLLTHGNLLANIRAYGTAIKITTNDVAVSWLPLYHDLGLIGMWLGSLCYGIPLVLLSPLAFLNHPEKWLWAIHHYKGTISAGPNFSYELCVRKIEPASIEKLDLSSWRLAINGAEAVLPSTLKKFTAKFLPFGFKPETFIPVYGLAESCVGVTASSPESLPVIDRIDRKEFEEKKYASPIITTNEKNILEFVSCGKAIPDHKVRIVDEANVELADRHVGQLQFQGPSSLKCYYNNPEATQAIYQDGWCNSGDLAYKVNEEVYIAGRKKDLIIKAGRNFYPVQIEELVGGITEIRKGSVVAFSVEDSEHGTEKLIVIAETRSKKISNRDEVLSKVSQIILTSLDITPDDVVLVAPQTIPKTSSGKLQRAACKEAYLNGKLFKSKTPVWLQQIKIFSRWMTHKIKNVFIASFNLVYTFYCLLLFLIVLFPAWLTSFVLPQKIIGRAFKFWAKLIIAMSFCPITIKGKKNLKYSSPLVYVSNHTSYLDTLLLVSLLPSNTRFISKKELLKVPILNTILLKLKYIVIDRLDFSSSVKETKKMVNVLNAGNPLFIFPEGTFTSSSGLRPFKLGAFKIATEAKAAICPISIKGARQVFCRKSWLIRPRRMSVTITKPISSLQDNWEAITHFKNIAREEIAKYCGESTLDWISAGPANI